MKKISSLRIHKLSDEIPVKAERKMLQKLFNAFFCKDFFAFLTNPWKMLKNKKQNKNTKVIRKEIPYKLNKHLTYNTVANKRKTNAKSGQTVGQN